MSTQKVSSVPGSSMMVRRPSLAAGERALRRADRLIARGEYAQAVASLKEAFHAGVDSYGCALRIADLYRQMERWSEALEAAEQAALLGPSQLQGWEMLLDIAEAVGDADRTVAASKALIRIFPGHIRAHTTLGDTYMQQGDIRAALRIANALIQIEPESAAHHFHKALLCQHQSEIEMAVYEFMKAIRLDPEGPYSEPALAFLQDLDVHQLNQIVTLALDDTIFRTKLDRDCRTAAIERGFALSPAGEQLLQDYCEQALPESPSPRLTRYH